MTIFISRVKKTHTVNISGIILFSHSLKFILSCEVELIGPQFFQIIKRVKPFSEKNQINLTFEKNYFLDILNI